MTDADVWHFQHPVAATASAPIQPITITAELDMGLPLEAITAPYHALAMTRQRQLYKLALADGRVPMDRDFELRWRPQTGREPQAALFHEVLEGEDYALLMVLPPSHTDPTRQHAQLPRELVFVIDTSGSMGGSSISQARASLAFALDQQKRGQTTVWLKNRDFPAALARKPWSVPFFHGRRIHPITLPSNPSELWRGGWGDPTELRGGDDWGTVPYSST